ncbi:MAG: ferritin family protein [Syntrophobacteraceae bacterium]
MRLKLFEPWKGGHQMRYGFNAGEVFKVAIQIEENGRRFYEESQKNIESAEIRALFADLALQEIGHKRMFETLLAQLPPEATAPTVWDPQNEIDQYVKMMADIHVFVSSAGAEERVGRIRDAADALKLAIEFEKDSVLFFLSIREAASGKNDRELINSLVKEEQEHLRRLTLELRKLSVR